MIHKIHSNTSYLTESGERSIVGKYFYMGDNENIIQNNESIHIIEKIIKNIVSSVTEAEIAGVFINAKAAVTIRLTLEEMGHPQGEAEIVTDNSTVSQILNKSCK